VGVDENVVDGRILEQWFNRSEPDHLVNDFLRERLLDRLVPLRCKAMKPTRRPLKSSIPKRSIIIGGKKTSISLEEGFWKALRVIVKERQTTLQELVTSINFERQNANLASAVRVFVLDHFAAKSALRRQKLNGESNAFSSTPGS
jgi:predicted DNA-binding ribbon-helix-helix protein